MHERVNFPFIDSGDVLLYVGVSTKNLLTLDYQRILTWHQIFESQRRQEDIWGSSAACFLLYILTFNSWDYCCTYRMALKRWLQAALCFLQCGRFAYGSIKSVTANSPQSTFGRLKWKMQLLESNIKLFLKCRDLLHQAIHPVLLYSTNVSTGDIYLHIYTTHQRARHIFAPVFMVTYRLEPLLHSNCGNTQKDEGKKRIYCEKQRKDWTKKRGGKKKMRKRCCDSFWEGEVKNFCNGAPGEEKREEGIALSTPPQIPLSVLISHY